jgi:outer membrane protein assembly factor BamB
MKLLSAKLVKNLFKFYASNESLRQSDTRISTVARCILAFAITISFLGEMAFPIDSLPNDAEANQLGLVIQWRAQSQRTAIGTGKTGMVLWPSKEKQEGFIVKAGNREVARIDANQVDRAAVEKLVFAETRVAKLPKLGIEAAEAQANQIAKYYKDLKRTATIEKYDESITYLVTASRDGAVEGFNAESGKILWSTSIGDYTLPTYGPGVNDDFVAVSNGSTLYAMDTKTGKLIGQRKLNESLAASPQPVNNNIYCSTLSNAIISVDATNIADSVITSARFSSGVPSAVTPSHNRMFIAWPNKNFIYVAQSGRSIALWSRLVGQELFVASPQATTDGFIAVSSTGMVYRINLSRTESIVWRANLAAQCTTTPLVADGMILVVTDSGAMVALSETDGERLWIAEEAAIAQPLAITPERVYAQQKAGQLVAIDRKTGKTYARVERAFATGMHNDVNDRIILCSESGAMISLHEPNSIRPRLNRPAGTESAKESKESKKQPESEGDMAQPAPGADVEDPFGSPAPMNKADGAGNADDPFGAPPSDDAMKKSDDPFGGF